MDNTGKSTSSNDSKKPNKNEELERLQKENEEFKRKHEEEIKRLEEEMQQITRENELRRKEQMARRAEEMRKFTEDERLRTENLIAMTEEERRLRTEKDIMEAARVARERKQRERELQDAMDKQRGLDTRLAQQYREEMNQDQQRWETSVNEKEEVFRAERAEQDQTLEKVRAENSEKIAKLRAEADKERENYAKRMEAQRQQAQKAFEMWNEKWKKQMIEVFTLIQQNLYDRAVEQKWANRLASLRDAHSPVHRSFISIRYDLQDLTKRGGENLPAHKRSEIEVRVTLLLGDIKHEEQAMAQESEDMQRLSLEHPDALFLSDIKESVDKIKDLCGQIEYSLQPILDHLKNEYEKMLEVEIWSKIQETFDMIEKAVGAIPTVYDLKQKY